MGRKKGRKVLTGLIALGFLFSMGMVLRQQAEYRQIVHDRAEAVQLAGLSEQGKPLVQAQKGPELPEEAASLAEVDLAALRAVNEDVVGWISIPGTELSYPLVQGEDNQYYLTHTWRREASSGGAVFLECMNRRDMRGFHTIAYAHRMNNDTMFGTLKYYRDSSFWEAHPSIYVVTDEGIARYDIFSAEEVSVTGIVYRLDLEESELEAEFLQACMDGSVIDTGIVPKEDARVLTLSTCTGNGHATRWVVHGTLVQTYRGQSDTKDDTLTLAAGAAARLLGLFSQHSLLEF